MYRSRRRRNSFSCRRGDRTMRRICTILLFMFVVQNKAERLRGKSTSTPIMPKPIQPWLPLKDLAVFPINGPREPHGGGT